MINTKYALFHELPGYNNDNYMLHITPLIFVNFANLTGIYDFPIFSFNFIFNLTRHILISWISIFILNLIYFQYELGYTAYTNRKQANTTIYITVRDINDNPPTFERPTYRAQITEEDDRLLPRRILKVSTYLLFIPKSSVCWNKFSKNCSN